jgi:hypothetical protein
MVRAVTSRPLIEAVIEEMTNPVMDLTNQETDYVPPVVEPRLVPARLSERCPVWGGTYLPFHGAPPCITSRMYLVSSLDDEPDLLLRL